MKRLFVIAMLLLASSFFLFANTREDYKDNNLVDTLEAAGNFQTLLSALKTSGLIDTLKEAGPFTIFAPNDEAFAKLPPGTLDALMKDPTKMRKVLLYHVTAGRLSIKDLLSKTDQSITMMENTKAEILDNGFDFRRPQSQNREVATAFPSKPSEARDDRLRSAGPSSSKDKIQDNGLSPAKGILINRSAKVITADLSASNGMIHVIDTVLSKDQ